MKKIILAAGSFLLCKMVFSQQQNLSDFNLQRKKISKNGMLVLGSWAAANVVYGSIASSQSSGSTKYFHQMNAIWNGVTLGLVAVGHFTAKNEGSLSLAGSLKQQAAVEKLFLLNAGLDVAYIAGGLYMRERSKNSTSKPERLKGYGESIVLQGSVLLLFDAFMYAIHNGHGTKLYKIAEKVDVAATANGVGVVVSL